MQLLVLFFLIHHLCCLCLNSKQSAAASTQIKSQTEVGNSGNAPSIGALNRKQPNSDISNQPSWDSASPFVIDSSPGDEALDGKSDGLWKAAFVSLLVLVLLVSCIGIVVWQLGPRICPGALSFLHWKEDQEGKMNLYEVRVDTDSHDGSEAFDGIRHDQSCGSSSTDSGSTVGSKPQSKESSSADLRFSPKKAHHKSSKTTKTKGRPAKKANRANELAARAEVDTTNIEVGFPAGSGSDEVSLKSLVSRDRRGSCASDISFMSSDVRGVRKAAIRAGRGDDVSSAETPDPDGVSEGGSVQASEEAKGSKTVKPAPPSCPRPPKCTRSRPPSREQQRPRKG